MLKALINMRLVRCARVVVVDACELPISPTSHRGGKGVIDGEKACGQHIKARSKRTEEGEKQMRTEECVCCAHARTLTPTCSQLLVKTEVR